jgi:hypothetical protein
VSELRQKANWRCEDQGGETLVFDGSTEQLLNDNKCDIPDGTGPGDIIFVNGDVVVDKQSAGGGILVAIGAVTITGQTTSRTSRAPTESSAPRTTAHRDPASVRRPTKSMVAVRATRLTVRPT